MGQLRNEVVFDSTGLNLVVADNSAVRVHNALSGSVVRTLPLGSGAYFAGPLAYHHGSSKLALLYLPQGGGAQNIRIALYQDLAQVSPTVDFAAPEVDRPVFSADASLVVTANRKGDNTSEIKGFRLLNGTMAWSHLVPINVRSRSSTALGGGSGEVSFGLRGMGVVAMSAGSGSVLRAYSGFNFGNGDSVGHGYNSQGSILYGVSSSGIVSLWRSRESGFPIGYWLVPASSQSTTHIVCRTSALSPDSSLLAVMYEEWSDGVMATRLAFFRTSDGMPLRILSIPQGITVYNEGLEASGCLAISPDKTKFAVVAEVSGVEFRTYVGATNLPSGLLQPTGSVTLQDYVGNVSSVPLTLEFRDMLSGSTLERHEISASTTGSFTLETSLVGEVRAWLKAPTWLASMRSVVLANGSASSLLFSLRNGDVDGDNVVGISDFLRLRSAYGSSEGGYLFDQRSDLNGDGSVGAVDFLILRRSFGQNGA